ncbi:MAG: phage baseplate protein [Synergistales bacterium]|nr:phage baseplate protein [Synergistales bacterium]
MIGIDGNNGKHLDGLDHLRQSVVDILTTPIGSRVMRRDYGSRLYDLVDHPDSDETVMEIYMAAAEALLKWEPRLVLTRVSAVISAARIVVTLEGRYLPDGREVRMEGIEVK